MKTKKNIGVLDNFIHPQKSKTSTLHALKSFSSAMRLMLILSCSIGFVAQPVAAESTEMLDIQHVMKPQRGKNTSAMPDQGAKKSATAKGDTKATHQANQTTPKKADMAAKKAPVEVQKSNMDANTATNNAMGKEYSKKCSDANKTTSDTKTKTSDNAMSNAGQNAQQMPDNKNKLAESSRSNVAQKTQQTPNNQNKMSEGSMGNGNQNEKKISSGIATIAQNATGDNSKSEAVPRPESGKFPEFSQADINADHYVTKEELKNFPYLLETFDHVDAGRDGKLEQHEYENLELQTIKTR
ncbi:hypothetical protein [Crenothrix sp.]|uniref:hypothetical protein n=1 Tax=Crenothrix sp. TaxID=3100433 RepID=UPI00374D7A0A